MDELDRLHDREDVTTRQETFELDAEEFETVRAVEESGIEASVGALVRDGDGRVALVRNHWSDGWILPGGKVERDETLREAVVREIEEETGLDASVERPLEVVEQEHRHGDESLTGHFVVFEALVEDSSFGDALGENDGFGEDDEFGENDAPGFGDDLGEDDAEIEDAAWFAEIPAECEDEDRLRRYF